MKRNTLNLIVDVVSALVMFGMVFTGLILRFVLPPRSGSLSLWSLGRHDWGDVHFWTAVGIGVVLIVHVSLHWNWVCCTIRRLVRRDAAQTPTGATWTNLYGAVFIVLLLTLSWGFVWIARDNVEATGGGNGRGGTGPAHSENAGERRRQGEGGGNGGIRGSMTLGEVAANAGIRPETLKADLGLPATTSADERLGWLLNQHGLTMSQVRQAVESRATSQATEEGDQP